MRDIVLGSIAALAVLQSSAVQAQTHPPGAVANEAKHSAWLELGLASADYQVAEGAIDAEVEATLLMFMFGGAFRVADFLEIGAAFPFTFADATATVRVGPLAGEDESAGFVAGNPFFRGSFLLETPRARVRAGVGVALPLAPSSDDDTSDEGEDAHIDTATIGAAFAHGLHDAWLYVPDRASLVIPLRADGDSGDVVWAAELALGMLLDADDDDLPAGGEDPDETETFFQTAGELGFRAGRDMVVGGRVQLWWHTSDEDEGDASADYDNAQVAIEPFFRLYGEGWFGSARLLLNLDEPLGIFGDGQGIWGLFLVGGWRQE